MADRPPDPSPATQAQRLRLDRLRERRNFKTRDQTLAFLDGLFKKQVAKPFRQLQGIHDAWQQLVPQDLHPRTQLVSLQRGVLTVAVDSAPTHFQLDEHVRQGLAVKIAQLSKNVVLRKIRIQVDARLLESPHNPTQRNPPNPPQQKRLAPPPDQTDAQQFDPELPR